MSFYTKLVVLVLMVAACQGILRRFCGLNTEPNRLNVLSCMRNNLPDEIKEGIDSKLREMGVNETEAVNRICEELSKDSSYKIPFEGGQQLEGIRSVQGVMASCVADEITKFSPQQ